MNDADALPRDFRLASCEEVQPPSDIPIRVIHPEGGVRLELQPITEIARGGTGWKYDFRPKAWSTSQ